MTEQQHPGATFLASMFGPSTVHPVFVCSLLNNEARGTEAVNERFVTTRNTDDIAGFARKWDRAGRGLFFCVSTLRPNARRRSKATLSELTGLHLDLDFKDVDASPDEVRRIVGHLMCLPSAVNASGHGLHLFWLFKEALEATPENVAETERLLDLLAQHLGGDPAAAEVSRLLRLPGTHNTKGGDQLEVTTEILRPLRYELIDLREWLELVPQPLIRRRPAVAGNGRDPNPWLEVARRQGYKPPVDVEQRLAAMQFQGAGDAAIHPTQLAVSASLLTHGSTLDEVVELLLAATRAAAGAAAGAAGERWNWQREERAIRDMCETWLEKHPDIGERGKLIEEPPPSELGADEWVLLRNLRALACSMRAQHSQEPEPELDLSEETKAAIRRIWSRLSYDDRKTLQTRKDFKGWAQEQEEPSEPAASTANEQSHLDPQPQEPEPAPGPQPQPTQPTTSSPTKARKHKRKVGSYTLAILVADGVIGSVRRDGHDLLLTAGELYVYGEGIWRAADAVWEQRLRVLAQEGAETLAFGGDTKLLLTAAWKRLKEHPGLYHPHVDWDASGKVALANGVLDLRTREFADQSPRYFLRRKLGVAYDPAAKAPQFAAFMARLFAERDPKARAALVELLQEFTGGTLCVPLLHREQRRALFLVGPSRTGKTELARLLARLVGSPVASPSVGQISERFGLACFFDATAWIRDDAVNEGDRLDPQRFKTIVTGEPIDIERKNRAAVRVALAIPVVLTANSLPASRDASDAVFNRSLVVDLTHVLDEQAAINVRRHLRVPHGVWLADFLFDREGPGIFNWALEGLDRLLKRGAFAIPETVEDAIQRFKDESNSVTEFARTMLEPASDTKVNRADLICAFHGWLKEEVGDEAKMHGARWLMPKLRSACPSAILRKMKGTRYLCGVKLTEEGLEYWYQQASAAGQSGRGSKGASALKKDVNQAWSPKKEEETSSELPF
jgi:P4 family phage/plasmid primase-like protien